MASDSNLVKRIRRLERLAKKATTVDLRNGTALGDAAETIDHIVEVVYDSERRIGKKMQQEKREAKS